MDRLEDFFRSNRKEFDRMKADASIWEGIEGKLDPKPSPVARPQRFLSSRWLSVAAALALLLTVGWWFSSPPSTNDLPSPKNRVGLEVNDIFPDIALRNPDGKIVSLSSLKGKVVLVELWASYSKICTEDHCYYFKPIYNEYKNKGFEIYAVSVDSSAASWVDAIESDQLDWLQVSDLQGLESPMVELVYDDQLPTTYLLDQDGRIIAKNLDVELLEDTLSQLLAFH
ncbi:MAG: TlpA disulfide reductase family protein [Bacteroidota bacterium]